MLIMFFAVPECNEYGFLLTQLESQQAKCQPVSLVMCRNCKGNDVYQGNKLLNINNA